MGDWSIQQQQHMRIMNLPGLRFKRQRLAELLPPLRSIVL
jgi:hypothetical protein